MPRTWTREHAINLQTRRKAQRWTLDQLARRASLEVETVQELERAELMELEDEDVLRRLATTLGVLPKQLCNSPLTPSRLKRETTAQRLAAAATHASVRPAPTSAGASPGPLAVGLMILTLVGAVLVPRACQQTEAGVVANTQKPAAPVRALPARITSSAPDIMQAQRTVAMILDGGPLPSPRSMQQAMALLPAGEAQQVAAALAQRGEAEAEELLAATLGASDPAIAVSAVTTLRGEAPAKLESALLASARIADGRVADRLVIVLVLNGNDAQMGTSLAKYLEALLSAYGGDLPWPHPAVQSALILNPERSPAVEASIQAALSDAKRPDAEKATLRAVAAGGVTSAQITSPITAPIAPAITSLNASPNASPSASPGGAPASAPLTMSASAVAEPPASSAAGADAVPVASPQEQWRTAIATGQGAEVAAAINDSLRLAMQQPVTSRAQVGPVLEFATLALQTGDRDEIARALTSWMRTVPSAWLVIESDVEGLWRMLGWLLYPDEAPRWQQVFGTQEETWLILVVSHLLGD